MNESFPLYREPVCVEANDLYTTVDMYAWNEFTDPRK